MKSVKTVKSLSLDRFAMQDYFNECNRTNNMSALFEVDITDVRKAIRRYRRETDGNLSLTTYLLWVFARTIDNNKMVQAYRKRKKIIIFDDVDIQSPIERVLNGEYTSTNYIVKAANKKSLDEIEEELRIAQTSDMTSVLDEGENAGPLKKLFGYLVLRVPRFIRKIILKNMMENDPQQRKEMFGTASISSLHMFADQKGWGIPLTLHWAMCLLGGVEKVPAVLYNEVVIREKMSVTVSLCHNLLDGAQAARFMKEFSDNVKSCLGLEEFIKPVMESV